MSIALVLDPPRPAGAFVARRISLAAWAENETRPLGEVVGGWLTEEEMPNRVHEGAVGWFVRVLGTWGAKNKAWVFGSGTPLAVAPETGRIPDAVVWLRGAPRPSAEGPVTVPPSITIEVVTPTRRDEYRDRVEKFDEYAAFGVRYYWIVDPLLRTLEIYELQPDGRYARAVAASENTLSDIPGCPGLVLEMSELWSWCDEIATAGDPDE